MWILPGYLSDTRCSLTETRTRGKKTGYRGPWGSIGTLDDTNPTRLSKQYYSSPLTPLKMSFVRVANSKAGIKPTAPLSAFNKENSIEFPLDFLHYLYNYYMVCALFSYAYHVTNHVTSLWHHVMWRLWLLVMWPWLCDYVTWHFPALPSV